ncbi:MAG: hypothetical protein ABFD53_10755 [Anaerolineaceae bacterium]
MPLCDVCNKKLDDDEGYLLTTAEITASKLSWKCFLERTISDMPEVLHNPNLLSRAVFARASSDSPWQVCEQCSTMFEFNRKHAHTEWLHFRQTGEPSEGFAVCKLSFQGRDIIADPLDKSAWDNMLEAVSAAMREIRQELSMPPTEDA